MPTTLVVAPDMYTYLLKYFKRSKLHRVSEWKLLNFQMMSAKMQFVRDIQEQKKK